MRIKRQSGKLGAIRGGKCFATNYSEANPRECSMSHTEASPEPELSQAHTLSDQPSIMPPNPNAVADALERKIREQKHQQLEQEKAKGYVAFDEHHEKRQNFRRMIDPGILRPNPRPLALESLQVQRSCSPMSTI